MTALDRHVVSGQDYTTWANNMVAQGKMHWPTTSAKSQIEPRAPSWDVHSLACGFIGGTESNYRYGEAKFCDLIRTYASGVLQLGTYILQDGLCDNNQDCTLIIDIAFSLGGLFTEDKVTEICEQLFEAVWSDCNRTGGSGQVTVGSETGTIQAQFFINDDGATCPANSLVNVCQESRF